MQLLFYVCLKKLTVLFYLSDNRLHGGYMIFPEKLQLLRRTKGFTQEVLAEKLNVSRQAVAKWESAQGYPDIANLIALSELFCVQVDYLVKDDDCQKKPTEKDETAKDALANFLLEAKNKTYAGKGLETQSSRPLSHDFKYESGDFLYIDTYLGGESFAGEEAVWKQGNPIFSMNYVGRVLDSSFSGDFLKAALRNVPKEKPFRGPEFFQDKDSIYKCSVTGDTLWFQGYEEIVVNNKRVYECVFHGGKVN